MRSWEQVTGLSRANAQHHARVLQEKLRRIADHAANTRSGIEPAAILNMLEAALRDAFMAGVAIGAEGVQ